MGRIGACGSRGVHRGLFRGHRGGAAQRHARGIRRIRRRSHGGEDIVKALHALEEGGWDAWRGEDGDLRPHKITQAELSHLMKARFRVKSRSIWPPGPRRPEHKSRKGFWRVDLEPLWAAYCGGAGTTARPALRVIGK